MNKSVFSIRMFLMVTLSCMTMLAYAQGDPTERKSPLAKVSAKVNGVSMTIDYSRPAKRGRHIWGGLVKYGQVWRTGANEATVFKLSSSARINGELLKEGSYALFTIPGEDKWTIIFNSEANQWGSYSYDQSKDVLRIEVTPSYDNPSVEDFTIEVDESGNVILKWDKAVVSFKVS